MRLRNRRYCLSAPADRAWSGVTSVISTYSVSFDFGQLRFREVQWWRRQGRAGAGRGAANRLRMADMITDNWEANPSGSFRRRSFELWHDGANTLGSCSAHVVRREGGRLSSARNGWSFVFHRAGNGQMTRAPLNVKTERGICRPRRSSGSGHSLLTQTVLCSVRMTAACESECMPMRRALVHYLYTLNVFMYNDLGPSAGCRTEPARNRSWHCIDKLDTKVEGWARNTRGVATSTRSSFCSHSQSVRVPPFSLYSLSHGPLCILPHQAMYAELTALHLIGRVLHLALLPMCAHAFTRPSARTPLNAGHTLSSCSYVASS